MHAVVLIAFNSHTKFEICSFIRCKDMTGAPQNLEMGYVISTTPTLGTVSIQ